MRVIRKKKRFKNTNFVFCRYAVVSFMEYTGPVKEGKSEVCEIVREDWLYRISDEESQIELEGGQMPGISGQWGTYFPPKKYYSTRAIYTATLQNPFYTGDNSHGFYLTDLGRVWKRNLKWKKAEKFLKKAQQYNFRKFPASQFVDDSSATCPDDDDDDDEPEIEVRTSKFQCFY